MFLLYGMQQKLVTFASKLLKVLQIAENGAMAKTLVENGEVVRNGEPESRKRAKIRKGEVIKVLGQTIKVI